MRMDGLRSSRLKYLNMTMMTRARLAHRAAGERGLHSLGPEEPWFCSAIFHGFRKRKTYPLVN